MIALRTRPSPRSSDNDLVLVHAFPLTSAMYDDIANRLQELMPSLTIHLVDLPGFGDAPYRERWTLVEAMEALHLELKRRDVVAPIIGGTSMGGYAAFAYYRLYPDEVRGLILSNTKASGDDEAAKKNREVFALDVEKRGHEAVYERMLDKLTSESSRRQHPELREKVRSWIAASEPRAFASAQRALALRGDSTSLLHDIEVPALIITGETDELIPPEESTKMQVIRNSHVVKINDTAHLSAVEASDKWADVVVSFLTTLEGSSL